MKPEGIPYDVKEALLNINGPFQYGTYTQSYYKHIC